MIAELPVEIALGAVGVNELEKQLAKLPQVNLPLRHIFTPGLYVREIFIPKGTLCTTKIHKTEHPFVISAGSVAVWTKEYGIVRYAAPFTGVTKSGTRRVIYATEDTIWSTFHPTAETDLKRIEAQIIEPHDIPFEIDESGISKLKEAACIQ